ncbi:hypothetical protein Tco_1490152, partial [Tanacetum coccineum]
RHSFDYSSDHFASDDSSRDSSSSSSSSSSSETSSDPSSDDLFDSSSDHSLPAPSSGMRPSHHLCSLVPSIPCSSAAIFDRPSHDSSSASPSCKRSRSPVASVLSPESAMDLEVEIDEYIAYADALRVRGVRGLVEVRVDRVTHPVIANDIPEPAQEEGAIEVSYDTLGDLVQRIIATRQQSVDMMERIRELERDNRRLRDMMDVTRLRLVLGGIWATILRLFLEYPSVDPTMPNTRSGASRTHEGINEQIDRQMAGALGVHNAARNLEPFMRDREMEEMEMEEMEIKGMEMEEMEMVMGTDEEMAITLEDLCLLESAHIKTS